MAKGAGVGAALSRRGRMLITIGGALVVVLALGSALIGPYVDWLWFRQVGFGSVFSTVLLTCLVQGAVVGLVIGGLLALNVVIAYRARPVVVPAGSEDPMAEYRGAVLAWRRWFGVGVPLVVGLIAAVSALGDWQSVQLFVHGTSFGIPDPQFDRDVSFYVFELPFYRKVLGWLFAAVVLCFFGALVTHWVFGGLRWVGRGGRLSVAARAQLAVLAGVFLVLKAWAYYLDRYGLVFSRRDSLFTGAGYTDVQALLPAKLILLCLAVICAGVFIVGAVARNLALPAIAVALLVLSSILVGVVWPAVVERFVVRPNANTREAPFIARNIAATRHAYGITDKQVVFVPYSGRSTVSPEDVRGVWVPNWPSTALTCGIAGQWSSGMIVAVRLLALSTCWGCPAVRAWWDWSGRSSRLVSGGGGRAGDLVPGGESGGHFTAVLLGAEVVATGSEVGEMPLKAERNRWACRAEVNHFMARSRARVGWWEFSALLFRYFDWRCSTERSTPAPGGAIAAEFVGDQHPG